MLDRNLAELYGTTTKKMLQQVRRNRKRFPADFAFQVEAEEFANLRSQIVTSNRGGARYRPFVITEHGAVMLASVLNTEIAVEASLRVVRAFVQLRELLAEKAELARKFAELESRLSKHDDEIASLFDAIRKLLEPLKVQERPREIGFHVKNRAANRGVPTNLGIS